MCGQRKKRRDPYLDNAQLLCGGGAGKHNLVVQESEVQVVITHVAERVPVDHNTPFLWTHTYVCVACVKGCSTGMGANCYECVGYGWVLSVVC